RTPPPLGVVRSVARGGHAAADRASSRLAGWLPGLAKGIAGGGRARRLRAGGAGGVAAVAPRPSRAAERAGEVPHRPPARALHRRPGRPGSPPPGGGGGGRGNPPGGPRCRGPRRPAGPPAAHLLGPPAPPSNTWHPGTAARNASAPFAVTPVSRTSR